MPSETVLKQPMLMPQGQHTLTMQLALCSHLLRMRRCLTVLTTVHDGTYIYSQNGVSVMCRHVYPLRRARTLWEPDCLQLSATTVQSRLLTMLGACFLNAQQYKVCTWSATRWHQCTLLVRTNRAWHTCCPPPTIRMLPSGMVITDGYLNKGVHDQEVSVAVLNDDTGCIRLCGYITLAVPVLACYMYRCARQGVPSAPVHGCDCVNCVSCGIIDPNRHQTILQVWIPQVDMLTCTAKQAPSHVKRLTSAS